MKTSLIWIWRFILVAICAVAFFVLGSALPIDSNYQFLIVESGSMEPAIKTGSVIAIKPKDSYEVGDIITFKGTEMNKAYVTHRIVEVVEGEGARVFKTKGDANNNVDYREIGQEEIIGKMFLTVPYAGYVSVYLGTDNGKALMATGILILLMVMFLPWKKWLIKNDVAGE